MSKYTDEEMLAADMYEDRDAEIRNYQKKIVTTRKEHRCASGQHPIPSKSRVVWESAIVEGMWATAYTCLLCIEKCLDSITGRV